MTTHHQKVQCVNNRGLPVMEESMTAKARNGTAQHSTRTPVRRNTSRQLDSGVRRRNERLGNTARDAAVGD